MRRKHQLLLAGVVCLFLAVAAPAPLVAEEYSLDDLFRIALSSSERLKVAEENVAIAEIGTERARSYLLPRLTATGGYVQYSEKKFNAAGSVIQPEATALWGGRVDETVSLSGREFTALGITKQNVTRTRYDLTAIREDYILRSVSAAYYNVMLARKNLEIADKNVERLTKYRDAAEKKLKVGEVTQDRCAARRRGTLRGDVGSAPGEERSRTGDGRPGEERRDQG